MQIAKVAQDPESAQNLIDLGGLDWPSCICCLDCDVNTWKTWRQHNIGKQLNKEPKTRIIKI